jgi:hypothetical protein
MLFTFLVQACLVVVTGRIASCFASIRRHPFPSSSFVFAYLSVFTSSGLYNGLLKNLLPQAALSIIDILL